MSFPIKTWLAVLETEVGINVWDPQFLKQKKPEKATNKRRESVSSPLRHLTSASQLTGPCRGWVATLFLPTQHPDRQQLPGVDITGRGGYSDILECFAFSVPFFPSTLMLPSKSPTKFEGEPSLKVKGCTYHVGSYLKGGPWSWAERLWEDEDWKVSLHLNVCKRKNQPYG